MIAGSGRRIKLLNSYKISLFRQSAEGPCARLTVASGLIESNADNIHSIFFGIFSGMQPSLGHCHISRGRLFHKNAIAFHCQANAA